MTTSSNGPDTIHRLIICHDCGKEVPSENLMLHQLRACAARVQTAEIADETDLSTSNLGRQPNDPMEVDDPDHDQSAMVAEDEPAVAVYSIDDSIDDSGDSSDVEIVQCPIVGLDTSSSDNEQPTRLRPNGPSELSSSAGRRRRRRRRRRVEVEVVDLVDSPVPAAAASASRATDRWVCPICTLYNSRSTQRCDACNNPNPERTFDPTRMGRRIDDTSPSAGSPLAILGGGAVMGGILGVAGSLIHGHDPVASAMEGSVTGTVGGALWNEPGQYYRHETWVDPNSSVAQTRSSASITGGYPSMEENMPHNTRGRARPRSSFRVERTQIQDDYATTVVIGGRSSTTIRQSPRVPIGMNDQMRNYLLHAMLEEQSLGSRNVHPNNIDGMMYDELLQAFGDGTENLGASEGQIESLPRHVVHDPAHELPDEARSCLICLDDITEGETRKILPCLHGFHAHCCDKWLKTNGSCPICKHRI